MTKFYAHFSLLAVITAAMPAVLWAGLGSSTSNVLKLSVGARAVGMGEAYVAQADDASSVYWNPAGLGFMRQREASFMYTSWLQGLRYQHAGIGIPLEYGALGGALSYLGYGEIDGYDMQGRSIGNQSAYSLVGTLSGAWLPTDLTSVGLSVKPIQESLADEKANGVAFDLGTTVALPKPVLDGTIRVGTVLQNLGTGLRFIEDRNDFPRQWRLGVAGVQMFNKRLNWSLDVSKPFDDKWSLQGGGEILPIPLIALRAGFAANHTEGSGIRAGIGLRWKFISFDYAYAGFGELGNAHRYELSYRFGEPKTLLTPEERLMFRQAKAAYRQGDYEKASLLADSLIRLVPTYKPARKLFRTVLAKINERDAQDATAPADPGRQLARPAVDPELEDLKHTLDELDEKTAQNPAAPMAPAATEAKP